MQFFDASALVKRYVREPESMRVRKLLRADAVAVSRLSEVEVVSAFARLARDHALTSAQRDRATAAFVRDLSAWVVVEVTTTVTTTARRLLLQHALRAGDALQLASALTLQSAIGEPLSSLVAYDLRLIDAARAEQLVVVGPSRA